MSELDTIGQALLLLSDAESEEAFLALSDVRAEVERLRVALASVKHCETDYAIARRALEGKSK